jgi:hypothetical protein
MREGQDEDPPPGQLGDGRNDTPAGDADPAARPDRNRGDG